MAEFAYNNAKNASISHTFFELNCGYYTRVSFEKGVESRSRSRFANELAEELRELIEVCCQNLLHTQELQKKTHKKRVKSYSYVPSEKVWLNRKYIKRMRNKKLKSKFFRPFQVLHAVEKQTYKLELPTKWKIHNIFYLSLLEQDTMRKGWVDKTILESEKDVQFEAGDNKDYEFKVIINNAMYG